MPQQVIPGHAQPPEARKHAPCLVTAHSDLESPCLALLHTEASIQLSELTQILHCYDTILNIFDRSDIHGPCNTDARAYEQPT